MKSSLLILLLAVSACIVQTRAGFLDSFTGGDDDKKGEDEELYQGGMAKQAMHTMVDVALDRALAELKEKNDIPMGDTVILLVTEKVKEKIHEAINNYGKKNEEEGGEQREENNEEGGFSNMISNVVSRRKRDVTAQQKPKRGGLMGWIKRKVMRNKGAETVEGGMDHVKHEEKFEEVNDKSASKDAYGEEDHSEVKTEENAAEEKVTEEKATEEKATEADKEEAGEETSSESDETKEKGEKSVSHSDETSKPDE